MKEEMTLVKQSSNEQRLTASTDMEPVQGTVDVDVRIDVFWACFRHANYWPRWNKCFFWTHNRDLVVGQQLIWAFQPIKPWYLYKMWAIAKIVELVHSGQGDVGSHCVSGHVRSTHIPC